MNSQASNQVTSENKLIYNNVIIDDVLTDVNGEVITLNVDGRGMAQYNIRAVDVNGLDGTMYQGINLQARELSVEILISAINAVEFRKKYERLNKILRNKNEVAIRFSDESDRYYFGIYVSSSAPKEDSNEQIITLKIMCSDPLKYTKLNTLTYANSSTIDIDSDYPVKPIIEVTFASNTDSFSIRNSTTGKTVSYKKYDAVSANIFKFDFDIGTITRGTTNVDALNGLVLTSNFEDFTIDDGNQVVITPPPQTVVIKYRGAFL
ncbi:distal tail protein Dit [Macrococcus armenti]|uniref:distal tail protein Dit n=1 Tax=Macrococcus armenti TaxID=2875764 RepID=UPI001CCD68A8|nr:distal tail protein Dit [Macrococcus armenti]UBH18764.1 phage tail family protein [Macrococcus armenti]